MPYFKEGQLNSHCGHYYSGTTVASPPEQNRCSGATAATAVVDNYTRPRIAALFYSYVHWMVKCDTDVFAALVDGMRDRTQLILKYFLTIIHF